MMKGVFRKAIGLTMGLLVTGYVSAQDNSEILDSLIQEVDTTAFGYGMEEDTLETANLLIENFDVQFDVDSITVGIDSLFQGVFHVTFDLKHPLDFGSLQIEVSRVSEGVFVLLDMQHYTGEELTTAGFLEDDSADISFEKIIGSGTYVISVVSMTTEGGASKVLTKTLFQ